MKRAYGHEPILLNASPITAQSNHSKQGKSRGSRRHISWIAGICVAVAVIVGGIIVATNDSPGDSLFPQGLQERLSFSLYTPEYLPSGWKADPDSVEATADVVTFRVSDGQATRLLVTEQQRPPQSTLDAFYEQQLTSSQPFEVESMKGVIGQFEGSLLAGVTINETWVLIRSVSTVDKEQFERVVHNVRRQ